MATIAEAMTLANIPDEIMFSVLAEINAIDLCHAACASARFCDLVADARLWASLCHARWPPVRAEEPTHGWRREYARRHAKDAKALHLLGRMASVSDEITQASAERRSACWRELLALGEEVMGAVASVVTDKTQPEVLRSEAGKSLTGLNQSTVLRHWRKLMSMPSDGVPVEAGALLLVQFYRTTEQLCYPERCVDVTEEIDAFAHRLRSRLAEPISAVGAVRALAELLCKEEGFEGNEADYYDHRNSLLDNVITSRKGIPISLSVLFAAVCARVGVPLDMIGLPGHFLLGTRSEGPSGERLFIDVFHSGRLLNIDQCEAIVRAYGIPWSEELARPVPLTEVWGRQVRNLANCHKQSGEFDKLQLTEALLAAELNNSTGHIPYPGTATRSEPGQGALLQMLQALLREQG